MVLDPAYPVSGIQSGALVKDVQQFRAVSVATDQQPSMTDVALQVEFGPAQNAGSDPVEIDASGNVTFNQAGNYTITLTVQFGRTGASGTSLLFGRVLINGTPILNSPAVKLQSSDDLSVVSFVLNENLPAAAVLTAEVIRDSTGANFGGLFQNTPQAAGWLPSPTAIMTITRSEVI